MVAVVVVVVVVVVGIAVVASDAVVVLRARTAGLLLPLNSKVNGSPVDVVHCVSVTVWPGVIVV